MYDIEFENFVKTAKQEKSSRRLHSLAESQLALYLSYLYPDACVVPEVAGVLGGRNDLMLFIFDGRFAVFEFFFSPTQVPQDLRLLEQSDADIKVAVLLDEAVDPRLAPQYFHKKPHPFPYLWLSEILVSNRKWFCLNKLRKIVKFANTFVIPDLPLMLPDPSLFLLLPNRELIAGDIVKGDFELPLIKAMTTYELRDRILGEQSVKILHKIQEKLPRYTPLGISISLGDADTTASKIEGHFSVEY